MLANQSANKTSGLLICLFCQSLDLNITRVSISIFSVSHLKSTQLTICSGTAFLMSLRGSFMFYDSCTYTFFTHSTLCHLLKTVGSGYGLSPPLCYHSPVPLLSVSQLGPLSCIWNPLSACMCEEYRVNVSSPRPYVIMKLWAFCLSFVWQYQSHILSLLYIDISIAKFLYSKHLCVCMSTSPPNSLRIFGFHDLVSHSTSFRGKQNTAILKVIFKNKHLSTHHLQ